MTVVLLWINGPFGGGKTQTAYEVHRRLRDSVVCDPEEVGSGLHRMLPPALRGDFQDIPAWRQGVREVVEIALRGHQGVIIVPMTLVVPGYFADVVGRLRDGGHDVHHVALLADPATVQRRLRRRGLGLIRDGFAEGRVDDCLERLRTPEFAEHIATDHLTVPQVAEQVALSAGLRLEPAAHPVRRHWQGVVTSARHIRRT